MNARRRAQCWVALLMLSAANAGWTAPTYPDTEKGLKRLLADLLKLAEKGNESDFSVKAASLVLPDHLNWFTLTFGETFGGYGRESVFTIRSTGTATFDEH